MTTVGTTGAKRVPMDRMRKTALVAGGLYLITFIAGIPPALVLYSDVLNNPAAFIRALAPLGRNISTSSSRMPN